ncbi:MAG: hypothetical protein KME08_05115 [Aphanothece sp. CMT-3BRIN-NPC111]|nr:hypothetical protein [Aphanothece sp. CMT-3BRIN-NPC111]
MERPAVSKKPQNIKRGNLSALTWNQVKRRKAYADTFFADADNFIPVFISADSDRLGSVHFASAA